MFHRILVGLDGSRGSEVALAKSIEMAKLTRAEVLAISVVESLPSYATTLDEVAEARDHAAAFFHELQRKAYDQAKAAGIELQAEVLVGHAARRIVDYATEKQVDLLVIGHSGHSSIWGQFLGTSADKIVRHARCSVLVVRTEEEQ